MRRFLTILIIFILAYAGSAQAQSGEWNYDPVSGKWIQILGDSLDFAALYDSVYVINVNLDTIYDTLAVHRIDINNNITDIADLYDSVAFHRTQIDALYDTAAIHLDTLQDIRSDLNALNPLVSIDATNIDKVALTFLDGSIYYESFGHDHSQYVNQTQLGPIYDSLADLRTDVNKNIVDISALYDTVTIHLDTLQQHRIDIDSKEDYLGLPAGDYLLASTPLGVRSWVDPTLIGVQESRELTIGRNGTSPITINGAQVDVTYDLSADRTWTIGHSTYSASPLLDSDPDTVITKLGFDGYGHVNEYSYGLIGNHIVVENQADNRILTATAKTDTVNSEAYLTYDGVGVLETSALGTNTVRLKNASTFTTGNILGQFVIGDGTYDYSSISSWGIVDDSKSQMQFKNSGATNMLLDTANNLVLSEAALSTSTTATSTMDLRGSMSWEVDTRFGDNVVTILGANDELPLISSTTNRFYKIYIPSVGYTVSRATGSSDQIVYNGASPATSVALPVGYYDCFNNGTYWYIIGIR